MSAAETLLPLYLSLSHEERGRSLNISLDDYRHLARTGLALIKDTPGSLMGIYRLPEATGCCLDIWLPDCCLTILIDRANRQLRLFSANLDSPEQPTLVFEGSNCPEDWQQLRQTALASI